MSTSVELFTRAECQEILNNALAEEKKGKQQLQLDLKDYKVKIALDVIGFLGEYFHLTLYYIKKLENGNSMGNVQQLRLFVKSMPANKAETAIEMIFQKEAKLYAILIKELQLLSIVKWSPACYYIRTDLFVMQDLITLGYKACTEDNLNVSEMQQILRSLAALHASSIIYEHRNSLNIGAKYENLLTEITVSPNVPWFTAGLRALLAIAKLHPKYQSKDMQNFIANDLMKHIQLVYAMTNTSTKYYNVLCHRDPWRGNIFFNPSTAVKEKAAILVDYQTCCYCPPCIDVIFTIFMNLSKAQRNLMDMEYLQWYYVHFSNDLRFFNINPSDFITQQQLCDSYEEFQLFGCVYYALANTILKVPKEFVTTAYKNIDRTDKVLEYMQKNSSFRICMEDCIEEIMELVVQK